MSIPTENLKLTESQTLTDAKVIVEQASNDAESAQALSRLLVGEHIREAKANFKELREGQKALQDILTAQNGVLAQHTRQLEEGAATMAQIDATTKQTNGKVKVQRAELDEIIPELSKLKKIRTEQEIEEAATKARREGLLVIPRKLGALLKVAWKYLLIALQWLGALGIIELIEWLVKLHFGK